MVQRPSTRLKTNSKSFTVQPAVGFALLVLSILPLSLSPSLAKQNQKETGMWSGFGIIDIHAHMGTFRGYDLSASTLLTNLNRYGIKLALVSNIDGAELPGTTENLDEKTANEKTFDLVNKNKPLLRGLVWTRPNDGNAKNVEPFLKDYLDEDKHHVFVGMKFHPEFNQFAADDKSVDSYLELCRQYGVPAVFHCGGPASLSSPARIYKVARRFPTVPIVLYHMGFGGGHDSAIDVVSQSKAKADAQLYLETAQADPDAVLRAVKKVGSKRVLFGTDATYYGAKHYQNYETLVQKIKTELTQTEFNDIVRLNAIRLFKLEKLVSATSS